jgi:DNA-binding CsgD family transcriptional regulator
LAAANPNPSNGDRNVPNGGHRQTDIADLALLALEGVEFGALVEESMGVVRDALDVGFVCVMESGEDRGELFLRAGTGWTEGEVGERAVSTGIDAPVERVSMAGYAMMSKDPVSTEDLRSEPRFGGCPLMREHGVVSGIMTKIDVGGKLYGVLGAHCTEPRSFHDDEEYWLLDVSRALGGALAHKTPHNGSGVREADRNLEHPNIKTLLDRLSLPSGLAPQHVKILTLLNDGYLVKEIAAKLNCGEDNVRKHLKKIYRSLGASGQVAAIARARQLGLFDY